MDGWMDGWMHACMHAWIYDCLYHLYVSFLLYVNQTQGHSVYYKMKTKQTKEYI